MRLCCTIRYLSRPLSILAGLLLLAGCAPRRVWTDAAHRAWADTLLPSGTPQYTFYLVGDAGASHPDRLQPGLAATHALVKAERGRPSALVFLGDNLYPEGLPAPGQPAYAEAETRLRAQLMLVDSFAGPVVFVPGNHDWGESDTSGWAKVQRQEKYVEAYRPNIEFLPDSACPWPQTLRSGGSWTLVALDLDYWLYPYAAQRPPGIGCPAVEWPAVRDSLERLLLAESRQNRRLLVAAHHPLTTNGGHGGHFTLADHLFPFRILKKWLWIPVPGFGSLYPLTRKKSRHFTDLANPQYAALAVDLRQLFARFPGLVYACGHEHVLQLNRMDGFTQLLSGAGAHQSPVCKGFGATFVSNRAGLTVLRDYGPAKGLWVEFLAAGNPPKVVFRLRLE